MNEKQIKKDASQLIQSEMKSIKQRLFPLVHRFPRIQAALFFNSKTIQQLSDEYEMQQQLSTNVFVMKKKSDFSTVILKQYFIQQDMKQFETVVIVHSIQTRH